MDSFYYIGYTSSPFGLKGEIKVISDTNLPEKVFKVGNSLYIDDVPYKIKNYHMHKFNHLVIFEGYDDINKLDPILKRDLYIKIEDLNLPEDEYLYIELIGYQIIDDNNEIGTVDEILLAKKDFYIKSGDLIIPMIDKYLVKVDKDNRKIIVRDSKELIL